MWIWIANKFGKFHAIRFNRSEYIPKSFRGATFFKHPVWLCLQWPTNRRSYMIYRTAPFSMTLNNPYPQFQGHAIFDAEYLGNGTIYRHSFNGILIGTYTHPTQQCRFEWPRVTLIYLAKYSMTRSIAWFLCDSWASCFFPLWIVFLNCLNGDLLPLVFDCLFEVL